MSTLHHLLNSFFFSTIILVFGSFALIIFHLKQNDKNGVPGAMPSKGPPTNFFQDAGPLRKQVVDAAKLLRTPRGDFFRLVELPAVFVVVWRLENLVETVGQFVTSLSRFLVQLLF